MKQYVELKVGTYTIRGFEDKRSTDQCVLMFHGFTGHKVETNRMFLNIDQVLEEEEISSIRFDWLGHHESDGDLASIGYDDLLQQAKEVFAYANKTYKKIIVLGFSMGGALAIKALSLKPDRLILISPAINMGEILMAISYRANKINDYVFDANGLKLGKDFITSFQDLNYYEDLNNYHQPVLLIQGTKDASVPISLTKELCANHPNASLIEVKGANHGYASVSYMGQIQEAIRKFLNLNIQ